MKSQQCMDLKGCVRGTKPDIWKAVRAAKDINQEGIPKDLTLAGVRVPVSEIANSFAAHFHDKIKLNVMRTRIRADTVYNRKCKLIVQNRNFMTESDVKILKVVKWVFYLCRNNGYDTLS